MSQGSLGPLLVDARPVGHPTARQRGIGRYVTGMLRGLVEIGAPVVALYDRPSEAELLADAVHGLPIRRLSPDVVRPTGGESAWFVATQLMLHPIPLDPVPRFVTESGLPVAAIMYDVIPYRIPQRYLVGSGARAQAQQRAALARTLDSMLAISEFSAITAAEELDYPLHRIGVIGAGREPEFRPARGAVRQQLSRVLPPAVGKYVISVCGDDERKNTEGLLRAWGLTTPALRDQYHLVIACAITPSLRRRWERCAQESGVSDRVIFTGAVNDSEMVALHQEADLSVMPSLEEGFGLPVLEAAACGVPAICSNVTSLPEVLQSPEACFDPYRVDEIAAAIERAVFDTEHRAVLLRAGQAAAERWTWSNVARSLLATLEEHGPRWPRRRSTPTRRIALAGPYAGSPSGIGPYDEAILGALREQVDRQGTGSVLALVDGTGSSWPTGSDETGPRVPVRSVRRSVKPWDLDHIVAVLGSSPYHAATYELASAESCHLWLHEASLVGLHVGLAHSSGSERWARNHVRESIDQNESAELASRIDDDELLDAVRLHEIGVRLISNVVGGSRSVIVSSEQAAEITRSASPNGPPILVLPLAFPQRDVQTVVPEGADVVAVGWLAENKAPDLALRVLAGLPAAIGATLTFVGPALPDAVDALQVAAEELGVADRVSWTGRLDDDDYAGRIARARVGLQLRRAVAGEMSAAVADLVAFGVPTITTLETSGPSSAGLQVVPSDERSIIAALEPLLTHDHLWLAASVNARLRSAQWGYADVARSVLSWLDGVDSLEPSSIHHASSWSGVHG